MKHRLTLSLLAMGFIVMAVMGLIEVISPNIAVSEAAVHIVLDATSVQEEDLVMTPAKAVPNTVVTAPTQAVHGWLDEPFITRIAQYKGQTLQQALSDFWRLCQQEDDCDARLQALSQHLTRERLELLRTYPPKLAQIQALLGDELMPQDIPLADKVARIQALHAQVWGKDASLLYFDEYQGYQFHLNAQALVDIQDPLTLVQALTALVQDASAGNEGVRDGQDRNTHRHDGSDSKNTLSITRYETAFGLIPPGLSEADHQQVAAALAEQFLNVSQQHEIERRQQQVMSQQHQVQDYQQGLMALYTQLEMQRASELAHLSPEAWQDYSKQQKTQFRTHFFNGLVNNAP